jgi:hypothetical protein
MFPAWLAALIFFSMLGLILVSQVFWFWRAHRFVWARRAAWLRWLLTVPTYLWFAALLGLFLLVPLRWFWLRDSPVLVSLLWYLRRPVFLLPMGLWITAAAGVSPADGSVDHRLHALFSAGCCCAGDSLAGPTAAAPGPRRRSLGRGSGRAAPFPANGDLCRRGPAVRDGRLRLPDRAAELPGA